MCDSGVAAIHANWYEADSLPSIETDYLAVCVSHAAVTGIAPEQTHVQGLENLFAKLKTPPKRTVYVSTTGVFATCYDGRWIDESSPVEGSRPGTIAALAAEAWLQERVEPSKLTILRAAGIYGPERIPTLDSLRSGTPLTADPESWLNLIHVDDLAAICAEAATSPLATGLFCVADGNPVLRKDYYRFIADQIGASAPTFQQPSPSGEVGSPGPIRRRGEGSKRISNHRLMETLKYRFLYPSYREGLTPLLLGLD